MKVREQAAKDLTEILETLETLEDVVSVTMAMRARGWGVTPFTMLDTARDLGFLVVGDRIYPPDA